MIDTPDAATLAHIAISDTIKAATAAQAALADVRAGRAVDVQAVGDALVNTAIRAATKLRRAANTKGA